MCRKHYYFYEKNITTYQSFFARLLVFEPEPGAFSAPVCNHAGNCAGAFLAPAGIVANYYLALELGDWLVAIPNCEGFARITGGFFGIS